MYHAPHCSIELSAPSTLSLTIPFRFKVKLHHHANPTGNPDQKPITVKLWHTAMSFDTVYRGGYLLLHKSDRGVEEIPVDQNSRYELDSHLSVAVENKFVSIAPGASHTVEIKFPVKRFNLDPDERYSFLYRGGGIEWWDWGTLEDHREILDGAWDGAKGEGRPEILLAASNTIEFTTTE